MKSWITDGRGIAALIAVALILAALTGCSNAVDAAPRPTNMVVIELRTLPDGTRCAMARSNGGYYGRALPGGLSCDWKSGSQE